jgi:dimethylhistidine N-methyltransferase
VKTPLLLDQVDAAAYVPVDISEGFLRDSVARIRRSYPGLDVFPVAGDFTRAITLPPPVRGRPALGFFPGSTIGNFTPAAAARLLSAFAASLGADAYLAIGIDVRKDPQRMKAAYDDRAGVTASFNLNLLDRMNRELGGNIPGEAFRHRAVWNEALGRIEMHLAATRSVAFEVAGERFRMAAGETIHTENSYKYSVPEARLLAGIAGWEPVSVWTDEKELFSLHLWRVARPVLQP